MKALIGRYLIILIDKAIAWLDDDELTAASKLLDERYRSLRILRQRRIISLMRTIERQSN